jgi:hypothetical protein
MIWGNNIINNWIILSSEINGDISVLLGINRWFIIIPAAIIFISIIYFVNKNFSDNKNIFLIEEEDHTITKDS